MEERDFKKKQVSFYKNIKGDKFTDMSIDRVLRGIKDGAYNHLVLAARTFLSKDDKESYNRIKEQLPAVTFCGTFIKGHKAEECVCYNKMMVIDIDDLEELQLKDVYKYLISDSYVAAFWLSPSGRGYKGLVNLEYDEKMDVFDVKERHKMAFEQLFTYLLSEYGISIDKSGKDICRLCFMSSDEKIVEKETVKSFPVKIDEEHYKKESKSKTTTIPHIENKSWNEIYGKATEYTQNGYNRSLLTFIYKKLKKKNLSITDSWENWVKVAFAIASSVHPIKGRELFLKFCQLDGVYNDEIKSEHLIWDAYTKNQGRCSINTIIYLARQKGVVLDR